VGRGGVGETTVTDAAGRVARYRWTYDRLRHVARMLVSEGVACESCPPAPRRHRWDAHGRLAGVDGPQGTLHIARDAAGRPVTLRHAAPGSRAGTLLARLRWPDADALDWHRLEQPSVAPGRLHRITIARDASGRVVAVDERGWAPVPAARAGAAWAPLARRYTLGHRDPPDDEPDPDAARSLMLSGLAWVDGPEPGEADRIGIEQVGLDELRLTHPGGRLEVLRFTDRLLAEHRTPTGLHARMRHAVAAHQWLGGPTLLGAFVGHAQLDLDYAPFGELAGVVLHRFERRETITVTGEEPTAGAQMRALAFHRGRPSAIALADGAVLRRGFDDFGRVAWIDEPGAPRQWARHDASDRLVEHRLGDGHVLHHRRDTAGRLVETVRDGPAGREVLGRYRWEGTHLAEAANDTVSIRYGHDRLGRPEWVEHVFADAPGTPLRWRWHYDLAGRVAVEELPGGLVVRHEHAGREIVALEVEGLAAGPVRLDVAALHEPLALRDRDPVSPATTAAAAVDAATTVPAAPVHAGTRLLEAGGMRHLQDPHGRRAAKRAIDRSQAKQDRAWVHDDWRVRAERTHNGRLRHWLWAGARPVAMVEDGRLLRVVTDARGAPVRALEADGTQAWAASYDRDGEARVEIERLRIDLRLPGQVHDPETGLHHHHWRTYDPRAGRYLERDPLGLQPGWRGRADLRAYAGGDPVGRSDPWGLATLTWYALTTGADGRPLGRTQGFDRARWSFIVEDILPVPLAGAGHARPQPAGIDGLLFDPWGDFVGRADDPGAGRGNGLDAIAWSGATGRTITAAFAAHYGGLLGTMQRFVVEGFDDRRAGALATILAGSPSQRASCVRGVLESLPGFSTAPAERLARPALGDFPAARGPSEALAGPPANPGGPLRLLACEGGGGALPVDWRDALERDRVARYQAAAELQESPSASLGEDCAASRGCRSRARVAVNGRSYWASYGRTQFTVATFLAELVRLASPAAGAEAAALRAAIGFDAPVAIDGRPTTVGEAIGLARRRVDAAYRAFATLRAEFGRGLDAVRAGAAWDALPTARRAAFVADTGLGRDAFVDVLGFVATPADGRTEEEGRHAIAASAAATVAWSASATGGAAADALDWLVALFASRDAYDHVSRTFLRDNLRRVLAAPQLAGRFDNLEPAGTPAWDTRQQAIELDLARRVAVLHNAGRLELATRPELEAWLAANGGHWVAGYVAQFTRADTRGNWDALRCSASLAAGGALQLARLEAMPSGTAPPPRPGPSRRVLAQ
jgi:RHS repeat-associated protein